MTKKLLEYLKSLNLTVDDVEILFKLEPALKTADENLVISNIELVIKFGYPRIDMGAFIQINPAFLLASQEVLKETLLSLDDVEEELKNNPFLI